MGMLNCFVNKATNAFAESFNAEIKAFRTTLRGVADIKFFMFRLSKIYIHSPHLSSAEPLRAIRFSIKQDDNGLWLRQKITTFALTRQRLKSA